MTDEAVRTVALCKTYQAADGPVSAVSGLDLVVGRGEFFGLLGPNGAGKSTTIGMLTTRVVPTAGRAYVVGIDVARDPVAVKRRIGVVTQKNTMDRDVTLLENLEFRGRYFGLSAKAARRRGMELLERFGLADRAGALDDHVSPGQSRRAMVCRALMHRPEVLFLDEPTAGIDPQTRYNLWDLLRELNNDGQTVVLTTHYLEEAESLCDRLAIIDRGALLSCDTLAGIKASAGAGTLISITLDGDASPVVEIVGKLDQVCEVRADGPSLYVRATDVDGLLGEIVTLATQHGLSIRDASTQPPSLETAFLNLTGREYRE